MDECTSGQFDRYQAGRAGVSKQGEGQQRDRLTDISRRTNSDQQATRNLSQAQSTNTLPRQDNREGRPLRANEEVKQHHPNRKGHQRDRPTMRAEVVEKLVNN
ncbi:unnamed protein product [Prunus brigantina]